jgi:transmembrane sensor
MTDYYGFDALELSRDPSFRRWVLDAPGWTEDTAFWTNWLSQHPDRLATVEQARDLVLAFHRLYTASISEEEINQGVRRVLDGSAKDPRVVPFPRSRAPWLRWAVAASVVLLLGWGWVLRQSPSPVPAERVHSPKTGWIQRVNEGRRPLTLLLEDGSVITLAPGSQFRYPAHFQGASRPVSLVGEAFFEVAPRPHQPFIITTEEFTTTVLGTSFRICSAGPRRPALVIVQSGKVAVAPRPVSGTPVAPVVLTPNQQVTVAGPARERLVKSTVPGTPLAQNEVNQEQLFEDVSVAEVLNSISRQYGVPISYDAAVLGQCLINTSFEHENLRERISAVCQAVGATYAITNEQIVVTASGCTL